jgi:hypothetical protein
VSFDCLSRFFFFFFFFSFSFSSLLLLHNRTHSPGRILTITQLLCYHIVAGSARLSLARSLIIMDDPPPAAKRQKTTTTSAAAASENEEEPAILDEESSGATAQHDRAVMDLLRSLPPNIVANYIYPLAVKSSRIARS